MKKDFIVVIGGGGVEIDEQGDYFTRAALAEYLLELVARVGHVHFFPQATIPVMDLQFSTKLDKNLVYVHPLQRPHKKKWRKLIAWLVDICRIVKYAKNAYGIIEFVPAGFATVCTIFMPHPHIVYFGGDPRKRWRAQHHSKLITKVKHYALLRLSLMAELQADAVLVRDVSQLELLKKARPDRVIVKSMPISSQTVLQKKRMARSKNSVNLLYVGKLVRLKGIEDLLRALSILVKAEPWAASCRLTLVGGYSSDKGELTPAEICTLSEELGILKHIELTGYIDDPERLSELYHQAYLFVLPTRREGYPRVLDEAAAHGIPIVTTNLPEITGTLQHGKHAFLVEPENPEALADGIKEMVCNQDLREAILQAGSELVKAQLIESAASQHVRLLREIAGSKNG